MSVHSGGGPYAVLGLGLIGGSIARDLAARGEYVLGFDSDKRTVRAAARAGVISGAIDGDFEALRQARTVILAVPVDAAVELLGRVAPLLVNATLITDAGSTKAAIVSSAQRVGLGRRFVGSHPLAGDHRSGWAASRSGLFARSRVFVCPTRSTSSATLVRAQRFWRSLGAKPERVSARAHDAELAYTSHLPHLIAAALARTLARAGHPRGALGAGGRDATRLASSSPRMWGAIVAENGPRLTKALDALSVELQRVRAAAARRDAAAINALFDATGAWASR